MSYSDVINRALLRWLRDGETMTIDKRERRQRELWLSLRVLCEAKVAEIIYQDARIVTYGLASPQEGARTVGAD